MNDFASIENSGGLLKKSYDPSDEALEALRRRQQNMAVKIKAEDSNPKQE